MLKNKKSFILFSVIVLTLSILVAYNPNNNDDVEVRPNIVEKGEGQLGGYGCIMLFNVVRNNPYVSNEDVLELDSFQTFSRGAFSGKIKDFKPEKKNGFPVLINELMKEAKISTYEHLESDVCLYKEDAIDPADGMRLSYYVEHRYCTNSCYTGKYEINVELQPNGEFVGYRQNVSR